jgi:hypothetical protein
VRKDCLQRIMLLTFFLVIVIAPRAVASEADGIGTQGQVMEVDLKKNTLVVNERPFVLTEKTLIQNEKGAPVQMDKLKPKTWVYIVGVKDKAHPRVNASRIYLLPKYIGKKERNLYPFIQSSQAP